jgi:hypothetical protein
MQLLICPGIRGDVRIGLIGQKSMQNDYVELWKKKCGCGKRAVLSYDRILPQW